ncbi:MAG TPA: putative quinol monooxygenase [Actinomycetota bacterium]|nr:putative quinol monooxygenase [Actinomycetota bacterium]
MSKVSMVGKITVLPGKADEAEPVLAKMVAAAKGEPGVEVYSYHRGEGDTFWFFAVMADEQAVAAHRQTPAMMAAMGEFMPMAAGRPDMSLATPIAAIGFDA